MKTHCQRCREVLRDRMEQEEGLCHDCKVNAPSSEYSDKVAMRRAVLYEAADIVQKNFTTADAENSQWIAGRVSAAHELRQEANHGDTSERAMAVKPVEIQRNLMKIALWAVAAGVVSRAKAAEMMGISLSQFSADYDDLLNDMGPQTWAEQERQNLQRFQDTVVVPIVETAREMAELYDGTKYANPIDGGHTARMFLQSLARLGLLKGWNKS